MKHPSASAYITLVLTLIVALCGCGPAKPASQEPIAYLDEPDQVPVQQGSKVLVDSDFANGLGSWSAGDEGRRRNSWKVEGGGLACHSDAGNFLWTKVKQKEAVTVVCKFQSLPDPNGYNFRLVLFADDKEDWLGKNSVDGAVCSNVWQIGYGEQGNWHIMTSQPMSIHYPSGTVRFAYDPVTCKSHLWLDAQDLGEFAMPNKLTTGKYVMLCSQCSLKVEKLQVLRGIVPPSGSARPANMTKETGRP